MDLARHSQKKRRLVWLLGSCRQKKSALSESREPVKGSNSRKTEQRIQNNTFWMNQLPTLNEENLLN